MKRREFITFFASMALACPLTVRAQLPGKVYRVGLILTTSPVAEMVGLDPVHSHVRAFVHKLRDLGYVEGRNLILERRSAEGTFERFGEILAEVVQLKPDVIVTVSDVMTQEAKRATQTVPIVMAVSFDPVGTGNVASLARPGSSVTGVTLQVGP